MNNISNGMQVFFIQNERTLSFSQEKSIPRSCSNSVRYMRPRMRAASVAASSTAMRGCPGAPVNVTVPLPSSGASPGSAGQLAAGSAVGGGCCGEGTTQVPAGTGGGAAWVGFSEPWLDESALISGLACAAGAAVVDPAALALSVRVHAGTTESRTPRPSGSTKRPGQLGVRRVMRALHSTIWLGAPLVSSYAFAIMRWGALDFWVLAIVIAGCGGNTRRGFDETSASSTSTSGSGGGQTLPDAEPDASSDADLDAGPDAPADVVSDYTDPGCPDAEPPETIHECDPLVSPTGCEAGLACYPFVDRPEGEGCNFEEFGTICLPPGGAKAGDRCGESFDWCGAGLLCVVGALSGSRCLQICDPFGPNTCSAGLVCAPVDVEGYGVCG